VAEETTDQGQKTELPTQKRLDDARAKGNVARFQETKHAAMFAGAAIAMASTLGLMAADALPMLTVLLGDAQAFELSPGGAHEMASGVMGTLAKLLLPTLALLMAAAVVGGLASGRPTLAWERLKPKWSKLSPIAGLKRLLGMQGFVEFLKTIAKFAIVCGAAAWVVWPETERLEALIDGDAAMLATHSGAIIFELLVAVTAVVIALAVLDVLYSRFAFEKQMMMSRQEVREEHRQTEGSPEVRARIRELRQAKARQRMMAAVPTASVVIMNPTHFAVALKYEHGADAVPKCVAKGVDAVALRIRDVARESGVAVVENPPLARALHASVEVDEPVPFEHYAAVAEVIGYVMRLGKTVSRRRG
jgi:flagellar biosynthesis protein FlhB